MNLHITGDDVTVGDASAAILVALVLFNLPSGSGITKSLDNKT
jgi:hypothetical protein